MSEKPPWTKLEYSHDDLTVKVPSRGHTVDGRFSPYDVPEAFRGYPTEDGFVFEFKYPSEDEETIQLMPQPGAVCTVGKFSGRMYRLAFSERSALYMAFRNSASQGMRQELEKIVQGVVGSFQKHTQRHEKYGLVTKALSSRDLALT